MWFFIVVAVLSCAWAIYSQSSLNCDRDALVQERQEFESYKKAESARAHANLADELAAVRHQFEVDFDARRHQLELEFDTQRRQFEIEFDAQRHRAQIQFEADRRSQSVELSSLYRRLSKARSEAKYYDEQRRLLDLAKSNLTAIPYWAGIMADYETHGIELLASSLDWGESSARLQKVKSIREIRKDAAEIVARCKEAQYQLDYILKMFPSLEDFLEMDYRELPAVDESILSSEHHDSVRNFLSKEEYAQLTESARNQLALDRYLASHRKTKWQLGRDYEMYVGYMYSQKGYSVDYYGAYHGLEDLGRDLIAQKASTTLIIQCKYWSSKKEIHENHICQLHGTVVSYCLENNLPTECVSGVLVTNISLSNTAKRFAQTLGITVVEKFALGNYPCIKCNINRSPSGDITKIYHLPFDQQYDSCKIDAPGEFFAMTVAEAEASGFRRAFRWRSSASDASSYLH